MQRAETQVSIVRAKFVKQTNKKMVKAKYLHLFICKIFQRNPTTEKINTTGMKVTTFSFSLCFSIFSKFLTNNYPPKMNFFF